MLDAKARAQAHVDRGNRYCDQGAFANALEEYQAAYAVFSSPKLLYNLAQVERQLGMHVAALAHYEAFLLAAGSSPAPDIAQKIEVARAAAAAVRATIAEIEVVAATGAEVFVDAYRHGTAPLAQPVRVDPGSHRVLVRLGGLDWQREVDARPGEHLRIEHAKTAPARPLPALALAAGAPEAPALHTTRGAATAGQTSDSKPLLRRWSFWAAVGALVLGAGAVVWLVQAHRPSCPGDVHCF